MLNLIKMIMQHYHNSCKNTNAFRKLKEKFFKMRRVTELFNSFFFFFYVCVSTKIDRKHVICIDKQKIN